MFYCNVLPWPGSGQRYSTPRQGRLEPRWSRIAESEQNGVIELTSCIFDFFPIFPIYIYICTQTYVLIHVKCIWYVLHYIYIYDSWMNSIPRETGRTISSNLLNIPRLFLFTRMLHPWFLRLNGGSWWKPLQWTLVWMNSSARFLCQMPGTHSPTNVPPNTCLELVQLWRINFQMDGSCNHQVAVVSRESRKVNPFVGQESQCRRPSRRPAPKHLRRRRWLLEPGGDFVGGCGLVARLVQLVMLLSNNLRLMNILQNLQWPLQVVHEFWPSTVSRGMTNSVLGWAIVRMLFCILYSLSLHTP